MFEEANSEDRSSTSQEEQDADDQNIQVIESEEEGTQDHKAQMDFMQAYVLTTQDKDRIGNARPLPKKKKIGTTQNTHHDDTPTSTAAVGITAVLCSPLPEQPIPQQTNAPDNAGGAEERDAAN